MLPPDHCYAGTVGLSTSFFFYFQLMAKVSVYFVVKLWSIISHDRLRYYESVNNILPHKFVFSSNRRRQLLLTQSSNFEALAAQCKLAKRAIRQLWVSHLSDD